MTGCHTFFATRGSSTLARVMTPAAVIEAAEELGYDFVLTSRPMSAGSVATIRSYSGNCVKDASTSSSVGGALPAVSGARCPRVMRWGVRFVNAI